MADRGASALSLPENRPAAPDTILALNHMGSFDWDLDAGLFHMDARAHEIFDLSPDEYDGRATSLAVRVPPPDAAKLDAAVARAIKDGSETYGAYFRVRRRDGTVRWAHSQGAIQRDGSGRPRRVVGLVRDATQELAASPARAPRTAQEEAFRQQTSVVEAVSAALAHARSVQDVIDALKDTHGIRHLGAASVVIGLVEAGRIRLVAEGPTESFVPGTRVTRIDEPYPMSEVVRTLVPRFIESPEEFAEEYPILWPHITELHITSAAYLPLIAQGRPSAPWACSTATGAASPPRNAPSWSPSAAASPRASSAPCSTSRRKTSPRASSRRCCPAPSPASGAPTWPCATAPPPSAGTSAATGTT